MSLRKQQDDRRRSSAGSCVAIAMAIVVLPFLVLVPVLAGVVVFHDHGEGLHAHRFASVDAFRATHHASHGHGDMHRRHGPDEWGAPEESRSGVDGNEHAGVVLVVSSITVGFVTTTVHPVAKGTPSPRLVSFDDTASTTDSCTRIHSRDHWRAPPVRGIPALLSANHAILI